MESLLNHFSEKIFLCFLLWIGVPVVESVHAQNISFDQSSLDFGDFPPLSQGTSLKFGPDERLYAAQLNGEIKVYTIINTIPNKYEVTGVETILGVKSIPNRDDNGNAAYDNRGNRQITGIAVAGTPSHPEIYVGSSDPKWGGPSGDKALDTNSGVITRLKWTGSEWEVVDLVRGLPRSEENHSTNGLEHTYINGSPYLLVASGGLTNAGSPSKNFAFISEYALSAAILSIDLGALGALSTKEDPISGRKFKYDIPTLDDPTRANLNGIYDPHHPDYDGIDENDPFGGNDGLNMGMIVEGGPVQIFSAGFRNAYDLVVTEKGMVYATDNGANINWGGLPDFEGNPNLVNNSYNESEPGGSPLNPSPSGEYVDNRDHLLLITADLNQYQFGSFYAGHPTPIRANPGVPYEAGASFPFNPGGAGLYTKFIGDDNNWTNIDPVFPPSDKFRTEIWSPVAPGQPGFEEYAANSLPANWPPVPSSLANPAEADFIAPSLSNSNGPQPDIVTPFPNNTNGIDEYKASNFGGALKGSLIAGKNGGEMHLINLKNDGSLENIEYNKWNLNGGNALGIACNGDEDIFPGTIWVATFDNRIMILTPADHVICISPDDPDFDPDADYDFDGYTNQDEIDNGTDYCSGASVPNDYDKDFVSDLNDLDDDGDGILDEDDPFQLGDPRDLPIDNELFTNQMDNRGRESGYRGLGLTGLMNNGAPNPNWLNWLDKGEESPGPADIYGGTAGAIQVSMTGGTANGSSNDQEKGFQFGVNVGTVTGSYTISSGLIGLSSPGQLYDFEGNGEVGIQIGDGTQSNFIKLVFTATHVMAAQEINDVMDADPLMVGISEQARPGSNTLVQLSFDINPVEGTVEPFYKFGDAPRVSIGMMDAQGKIKEAIQQLEVPLAIGIYGTSNDWEKSFIGVWNYFRVEGDQPYIVRNLRDVNRLMGDPDYEINLNNYFNDNGGVNNLSYSVKENTDTKVGAVINENMLSLSFPDDAISTDITIRATDQNGLYVEQTFNVSVEQDIEILMRINAGGVNLTDSMGNPDWLANDITGAFSSDQYRVNSGLNSGHPFDPKNRHSSIPSYISDEMYIAIFGRERYNNQDIMEFSIPLPDGDYLVNLYMGNGFEGTSSLVQRVFDVSIESQVVDSNIDLVARYGHRVGAMQQYPINVSDGELNISFIRNIQNPLINGIEIIGKPIQTPIAIKPLTDQIDFAGTELDGGLFVEASGGDGNLNYFAEGLPPGLHIDPASGTLYGKIDDEALANSPYQVTITVDDDDPISSDAVSFYFTWIISPGLRNQTWKVKNEDESYSARHENAFVQAGNKFYLLGGRESSRTINIYDYTNDTWKSLSNINPLSFNHFQAVEYQGLIWVIGAFKTNNFPDEEPADHIWIFDPAKEEWIQGPEIPEERRRGSTGLVVFNDKFYIVNGNKMGHNGGYVNYFDEYNPHTGEWKVLEDSPRPRDHFFASIIGNRMYVASGRLSGGTGGTFAPVIPEVDVYNFSTKSWSTLPSDQNIPTPRAGASVNNYLDKLIVAGGEVAGLSEAYAITEMYDPITQTWEHLDDMNFGRHGTQGIVSGGGLYVLAGSPNRGGGNQKNMEYFGFDNPVGSPSVASTLEAEGTIQIKSGVFSKLKINIEGGNQGIFIKSMNIVGEDAEDFEIKSGVLENSLLKTGSSHEIILDYIGEKLNASAVLEIKYGDSSQEDITLIGDGEYEETTIFLNSGTLNDASYQGEEFLGDRSFGTYFSSSNFSTSLDASNIPLFQTHRFDANLKYSVPVSNGVYTVKTYHHELYFGVNGPQAHAGQRVFDIRIEGNLVKPDFDLYVENNNQPIELVFENVIVSDGFLNIDMIASANNASISGLAIINEGQIGSHVIASIASSVTSGNAPLAVEFDGSGSIGRGQLTYLWDFKDGNFSSEINPSHVFTTPGIYDVSLTVEDGQGRTDRNTLRINVSDEMNVPAFSLFLNTGANASVSYEGYSYLGESSVPIYFNTSNNRTATGISDIPLYQSHRFAENLSYRIPVPNGDYRVRTHHNEFYFGVTGPSAAAGQRVFDIFLEGQLVKENFDLYVEGGNEPFALTFYNVTVTDGNLDIDMFASANNASVSGISIISMDREFPVAVLNASVQDGIAPLTVNFQGSNSTGTGTLRYNWDFDDGSSSQEADPSHIFGAGQYIVRLTVEDEIGNVDSETVEIRAREENPDFSLYLNTGSSASVLFKDELFTGDVNFNSYYSSSNYRTSTEVSSMPLYQSHRFDPQLMFSIPIPNGSYVVKTYHNEFYFGKTGPSAEPGRRVFDIVIENQKVKENFDIFLESGNQPIVLTFNNVDVTDGVLNIDMIASANSASISGIAIISIDSDMVLPSALPLASVSEGEVPLKVEFDGSLSTGDGQLTYLWDFQDGNTSNEVMPVHVFQSPGIFPVSLMVTDEKGHTDKTSMVIEVYDVIPNFSLYINNGTSANVIFDGNTFGSDAYFSSGFTRTMTSASSIPLYQSHRFDSQLQYNVPVPNGLYTVKTYHNEFYFGKTGPAETEGQRVFDIFIENELKKAGFDLFVESNNQPTELIFENIDVEDEVLNINMVASANNASISGIAIIRQKSHIADSENLRVVVHGDDEAVMAHNATSEDPKVQLFPNPANNEIMLQIDADVFIQNVMFHDMTGKLLLQFNTRENKTSAYLIPTHRLSPGVYMVSLVTDQGVFKRMKLIIKR
ncbi:malectin domain-containing carbohydrate-binding protein [Negadavirga shengliensis]|uniref:Malectin domain-containing carbohydrate-binding protein n=1 Tax=Negadavirga shengliensis TaxID=1389218 RepID=A0ABV9SZ59_9BACT